jgi:phage terminase large subunit-like protein
MEVRLSPSISPTTSRPRSSGVSETDWLARFEAKLTLPEKQALLAELESQWIPLPHQTPPDPPWRLWALVAGRGSGKTDADAAYVNDHAHGPPCIDGPAPHRIGIIAPTHDDAKNTCVVGESGLLQHDPDLRFRPGGKYGDLIWANGSVGNLFGAFTPEDVERLRGPQHCLVWAEELASWRFLEKCWDMMQFGLRLGATPHAIASSTPKPRAEFWAIVEADGAVLTSATTDDNPYLHPSVRAELYRKYGDTRLGQQELKAMRLTDVPGALWRREFIHIGEAPLRYGDDGPAPEYRRIVVAIDPAVTYGPESDETGIVAAGVGVNGEGYVLDDQTGRFSPKDWALRATALHDHLGADAIVAEVNNGGDLVEHTLRSIGFTGHFIKVTASRGKRVRAEPVASLYEQGRIHHRRTFVELEDQLCNFTPESVVSPDRLDALVWAFTELMLEPSYSGSQFSMIA